ncbi:MAG: IS5/IS1182 family transposase, partial [Pseudomonadota bacterium]
NARRSKVRAKVEHVFGRQAHMGSKVIRSIEIVRVKAAIGLRNLVYNMKRYVCLREEKHA